MISWPPPLTRGVRWNHVCVSQMSRLAAPSLPAGDASADLRCFCGGGDEGWREGRDGGGASGSSWPSACLSSPHSRCESLALIRLIDASVAPVSPWSVGCFVQFVALVTVTSETCDGAESRAEAKCVSISVLSPSRSARCPASTVLRWRRVRL